MYNIKTQWPAVPVFIAVCNLLAISACGNEKASADSPNRLPANIELMDAQGRILKRHALHDEYTSLAVSDLPPGMYLHRVTCETSPLSAGKIWIR
jgi:hypothetical protein